MKISQSFEVARPLAVVWELFQDVPAVAACMPGAELTEDKGNGLFAGKVGIKLGPFGASFEGEAQVSADAATHRGHAEGRGLDRKGGSRSKLVMDYRLSEAGEATRVDIDADVQLAGPIAQFGRTGIITETANVLIGQFVRNVEARLSADGAGEAAPANELSALKVVGLVMKSYLKRSGS
jgi:carbon monoxide dehydrogenase subunit G